MKRPLIVFFFLCFGWKFVKSEDPSSVNCDLFKVRTEDTSESSGYKDNDTSKYTYELKGLLKNQPLYKFKSGTKFVALLYDDEYVWQHTSAHDPSTYPAELEIDPFNNTLWIKYGGMDFLTFKFEDNKWKHSQDLSYGQCKGVTIPDYNATSVPSTPASPAEEKKAEEEPENAEEEPQPEPEAEEKPAEEATEVVSVDGEEKTEVEEPEKPEEGAPEVEDDKEHKEAEEKSEDAAEAGEAGESHPEQDHVSPEGEASKAAEAGTDGDASADSEAAPLPEEDASSATDTTPDVVPESAVPEAPEADASKTEDVVPDASTDTGLKSEDGKASVDEVLLSNLYPDDVTGSFHFGLRGTLFDEDDKLQPKEEEVSGSHVPSDADAAKPADEGSTASADAEEKSEEPEKAAEDHDEKTEEADKAAEDHKDKEGEEKPAEVSHVSTAPDAKPESDATVAEDKEEAHVSSGQGEEGAKPADATVAEPAAEVEDASKTPDADASTTPDADKGYKKQSSRKLEHEGKHIKVFTLSDDGLTEEEDKEGKYDLEMENNELIAKFKEGVKCVKLEYDNKQLWKHDPVANADKYPQYVALNVYSKHVRVFVDDGLKFDFVFDSTQNKYLTEAVLKLEHEGKVLKMFTLSDDSTQEESSQGKFEFELENKALLAKFREGVKCVKLEYEDKEVWKHDEAKHGTKHPTEVRFDTQTLEVELRFDDKSKYTYKYDSKSNAHAFALSSVPLDLSERPDKLKFFKDEDGNDEIGDAELTLAKESDGTKEFVVHSFNSGVKCHVVKYGDNKVWEYDEEYKDNYPSSVRYNKDDHELQVFVRANWFYFYKYDTTKNEHDIYREKEPADVASE